MRRSLESFDAYRKQQFAAVGGYSEYDAEIGKRLRQLVWLLNRARALHHEVDESREADPERLDLIAFDELEIIVEAFYFFAGRLTELFKRHPTFGNIPKTRVEMIRHRLLQHPEGQEKLAKAYPMFTLGSIERGPIVKG